MKLLGDLNGNARVSLMAIPVWSVFWGLVYYYSPLYMKALGLGEAEIGLAGSVGAVSGFACFLLASPLANRLGRKRATLVFDLLSWSIPMLAWAVARNAWFFLAAAAVNGLSKVSSISWNCLITEDEEPEKVPKVFTLVSLINSAIGVLTPLTGFFIARAGLVPTMRVLYAAGALSMSAMFVVRNFLVAETAAGERLRAAHGKAPAAEALKAFLRSLSGLRGDRGFFLMAIVFIATNFIASLNVFQVIYLNKALGYAEGILSFAPFAVALANVAVFALAMPRLARVRAETALAAFIALNAAASVLFLLIPARAPWAMYATMALNGAANFVLLGYRESVFMKGSGESEKADRYSAVQAVSFLCCIPAGTVGGLLYGIEPRLPFVLASLLYAAALAAALAYRSGKGRVRRDPAPGGLTSP